MQRWIVLAAGVAVQMVLGGVYAWSEFVPRLIAEYGLSRGQSGLIFGVMIAVFTVVMIPAGRVLKKRGPRFAAGIGAALFALGYVLASFSGGEFIFLLLALGVVTGAGVGFGYICPLSVCMKWFPNNKGLVTGVSVAGFGGGAILLSAVVDQLFTTFGLGVMETFRAVGLGMGAFAFIAAMLMSEPPEAERGAITAAASPIRAYLLTPSFLYICLGMFCGTFAGLLVVGNLKPLALSVGLTNESATLAISLFALGNASGRILWGQVHDFLGSRRTVLVSMSFLGVALLLLYAAGSTWMTLGATLLVGGGFGACFVVYASTVVSRFGMELFPRLYPICFLGYGFAALVGPGAGGFIADTAGAYGPAVLMSAALVLLAVPAFWFGFDRAPAKNAPDTPPR